MLRIAEIEEVADQNKHRLSAGEERRFFSRRCMCESPEDFDRDERKVLMEKLEFHESKFSKFATIGANRVLQREEVRKLLPDPYTCLYEIAKEPEHFVEQALKEGVICSKLQKSGWKNWLRSYGRH